MLLKRGEKAEDKSTKGLLPVPREAKMLETSTREAKAKGVQCALVL